MSCLFCSLLACSPGPVSWQSCLILLHGCLILTCFPFSASEATNFYPPLCLQAMSIMKFFSSLETVVQSPLPSSSLQPPPSSSLQPSTEELTPYENEEQVLVMPMTEKTKKRKRKAHEKFAAAVKARTGLDLHSAMDMGGRSASLCASCSASSGGKQTIIRNVMERWISHAKSCRGLVGVALAPEKLAPEAQAFVLRCMAGGDKHRKKTCDAYITTYWVYKYKLPFTTSPKLKEVCSPKNPNPRLNNN